LTNGVIGTVHAIKVNDMGQMTCVVVQFDNPNVGEQQRADHPEISQEYKDVLGTPIYRIDIQYQLPGRFGYQSTASAKLNQFPLRLAWAVTCHKVQGQTFKSGSPIIIHWHIKFTEGMAYVMLGRCETLSDLFITGKFNTKQIRVSEMAMRMCAQLESRAEQVTNLRQTWVVGQSKYKIIFLNIRSLNKHLDDLKCDDIILKSDLVCLSESWLLNDNLENVQLPGLELITASVGRGKGVAVYSKPKICTRTVTVAPLFQVISLSLGDLDVITVYRSSDASLEHVAQCLLDHIEASRSGNIIVGGDFNFPAGEKNVLTRALRLRGLHQIISEPTHAMGAILDHCYVNNPKHTSYFLHPVYYSDHFGLCITSD
jgi:endonuclease/exonuclease/phosphatase (EEP) superfamily protein YafD